MASMMAMMAGKGKGNGKGNGKGKGMVQQHNVKQAKMGAEPTHPKAALAESVRLLLGRSATKEDIIYEYEEVDGPQFVATLSIPGMEDGRTFKGAPGASKKEAETSAAEKAGKVLAKAVRPLREAQAAAKAEKNKAGLAKL